jgi:cytosine/adenosine deaminase-related metal-dependent hydrolase
MARLRFTADRIFTGTAMADAGSVLVMKEDGTVEDIVPAAEAGEDVRHLDGILCPGFVNAHCHLELSHLKNRIPEGNGLVPFLKEVVSIRESDRERVQAAMLDAERVLYENGVQAVGDVCNSSDSLEVKSQSRIRWTNFIEVLCLTDGQASERMARYREIRDRFRATEGSDASSKGLWRSNLSPHAPYSISPLCFQMIDAETEGQVVSLHNQETAGEDELYRTGTGPFLSLFARLGETGSPLPVTGRSSLQSVLPHFKRRQSLILVHNTFTSREDLAFADAYASETGLDLHYCLCPNANLYIEGRLPSVSELMSGGRSLVIGTDSYGSNRQLDVASEIRTLMDRVEGLDLETVLRWATLNGAKALRRDEEMGSLSKGKKPGLLLLDEDLRAKRLL